MEGSGRSTLVDFGGELPVVARVNSVTENDGSTFLTIVPGSGAGFKTGMQVEVLRKGAVIAEGSVNYTESDWAVILVEQNKQRVAAGDQVRGKPANS